jgi:alpha-N-acetylglucosaminidase
MAWWDWDRWQREIDWMTLNGINMPLALTGEEAIWQKVYREMGFTDGELERFLRAGVFLLVLDGQSGWLGWSTCRSIGWITHFLLQKKILPRSGRWG